jgi:type VII secretion integral membrane protein EccD
VAVGTATPITGGGTDRVSQSVSTLRALLRISVQSEGRRLDVGVPAHLPLIELMPGFARSLGVLDPTMTHVGYTLQRADGSTVDPSRGALDQGIQEGELLTLARGALLAEPLVYDDIVEAVLDATAEQHRPWTAADNTRTALAVSLTMLAVCAVLLVAAGHSLAIGLIVAICGAVLLLTTSAVLSRVGQPEAGCGLGLAAAAFGAVSGYLAVPGGESLWGWPLAAAGLGAVVVGGAALALTPYRPELQLVPVAAGAAVGIPAVITGLIPDAQTAAYSLTVAIVATLANALPWLALSSTRLRVISPQSDSEVFATPAPIDAEDVRRRAAAGHRALVALRLALGLSVLASTPVVAGATPLGAVLCALAFLGLMFPARQSYSRSNVLTLMALGTAGIAATGLTVAVAQTALIPALLAVLGGVTVITIVVTLLDPRVRIRLGRLADTAEVVVLALLLPIGVIAAGLA